jgi:dTDP-4-amino-4,6-dideoxygalactose transaminase
MKVPLVDLVAAQEEVSAEVADGVLAILRSAAFIGGKAVTEFEDAYAAFAGVGHCVGVANGTDAVELALRVAGVHPGDEVVLPANTFVATAEAVSRIGARPVLVDVDPVHLLIDPALVPLAVGARTRAIVPVHLFGQVAPVEQLYRVAEACGASIVEDAAQSQGATRHGKPAGGLGLVSGTSFYPGKNLGAAGDAGAVLTDDADLARIIRMMAAHGSDRKYVHDIVGINSRLDAVQAVVLSAKLERLAAWNEKRQAAASIYQELLAGDDRVVLPRSMEGNVDAWHLYVIQVDQRDEVLAGLNERGVGAGVHYPTPVHLTGAYADLGYRRGQFPVAELAATRILSLPIYPHITLEQQQFVVETLRKVLPN